MSHAMITANRLRDGVAVWRGPNETWVDKISLAEIFSVEAAESALASAQQDIARQLVVGVYTIQVSLRDGRAIPDTVRETIRARGPSVRLDLGIQAEAAG